MRERFIEFCWVNILGEDLVGLGFEKMFVGLGFETEFEREFEKGSVRLGFERGFVEKEERRRKWNWSWELHGDSIDPTW